MPDLPILISVFEDRQISLQHKESAAAMMCGLGMTNFVCR
jgi:hypothetical protein